MAPYLSNPWPRWAHILAVLTITLAGILTGLYLE